MVASACGDRTAQAPNPLRYEWPEAFGWHIEYVIQAQRDGTPVVRHAEAKTLRLVVRDDQYLAGFDSVLKTTQLAGEPLAHLLPAPEDTLTFYVRLGRRGEVSKPVLGCDPGLPACAEALPSTIQLQLRRLVPLLPVWEAPRGSTWVDTLTWDDAARPGGTRGSLVTTYAASQDTAVGGEAYWRLPWASVRRTFRRGGVSALLPEPAVREEGVTYVEKRRHLPVYTIWAGVAEAPADLRALGATASGFRGRAALEGSPFAAMLTMDR
jgi:hypothetical protein